MKPARPGGEMSLVRLFRSALRTAFCGLLVASTAGATWAPAESQDRCDMQRAVGTAHQCAGTQLRGCGNDVDPTPTAVAKISTVDVSASDAAIVRVTQPTAPTLRPAMVVPSRGLLHARIPILHAALLL